MNQSATESPVDTHSPFTPQDLATTLGILLVTKIGEALIASYFFSSLPLWMPLTWLGLVWVTGSIHLWYSTRPVLLRGSPAQRLKIERALFWLNLACLGSAAFFLYVPNNLGMHGVLNVCVVTIGALSVLQYAGDNFRGTVGAALAILPTATRYFFEDGWLYFSLGLGGYLVVVALAMFGQKQHAALIEQAALRKRAEAAADTVAAVGIAKARFFAAVSHDLRQPVHAIGLYLSPLLESTPEGLAKKGVEGIYHSWRALDDLLSQVLDLTRMDAGSLQAEQVNVELAPLIRSVVMQHSVTAEKKSIRIVALVEPQRYVLADVLMLKRVLSNLLDNAIKFSPDEARIVIALRSKGADWCIQVRDHGLGIPADMQAKVFEEFVQLDNPERDRSQGLGLGLAIARRFTELMQGQLRLRSSPSTGTCMSVYLPKTSPPQISNVPLVERRVAIPQVPLHVPEPLRAALRTSGKAILVVEDDALVAQAIIQLLGNLGLSAIHAKDAKTALALAPQACIAACDVRLPGTMLGTDLAVRLQKMAIPALLMTGETSLEIKQTALAQDLLLLIKPVQPQTLLDGLGKLTEHLPC